MAKRKPAYTSRDDIQIGDVVNYGFYNKVKVVSVEDTGVTMELSGTTKKVYLSLFLREAIDLVRTEQS